MALKVYSYSGCGTCRKALKWLEARKAPYTLVAIRETPPTKAELSRMLAVYGGEVRRLFNTSGLDYKALDMKTRLPQLSADQALALLAKNGNLVKRPFVLTEKGGAVGFDEAVWAGLVR
jgi:arsenate reductase